MKKSLMAFVLFAAAGAAFAGGLNNSWKPDINATSNRSTPVSVSGVSKFGSSSNAHINDKDLAIANCDVRCALAKPPASEGVGFASKAGDGVGFAVTEGDGYAAKFSSSNKAGQIEGTGISEPGAISKAMASRAQASTGQTETLTTS